MIRMSDKVHIYPHYIVIEFDEPLYSHQNVDVVRLDEKWIKMARKTYKSLVIRTKNGESVYFPKTIMHECKQIKEVFKRPDEPMCMREIPVPFGTKSDMDKWAFS